MGPVDLMGEEDDDISILSSKGGTSKAMESGGGLKHNSPLPRKPKWRIVDPERDPNRGLIVHPIPHGMSGVNTKLCPKSWNIKTWNM